eukprot:gene1965-1473_t
MPLLHPKTDLQSNSIPPTPAYKKKETQNSTKPKLPEKSNFAPNFQFKAGRESKLDVKSKIQPTMNHSTFLVPIPLQKSKLTTIPKMIKKTTIIPRKKTITRWTKEEDLKLKKLIEKNGAKNWRKISQSLGGKRTPDQCNQRWCRVINPGIIKGNWSQKEENQLIESVSKYGESSWKKISEEIKGRTDIQCRHHFYHLKRGNNTNNEVKASNSIEKLKCDDDNDSYEMNSDSMFWTEVDDQSMKDRNFDIKTMFKSLLKERKQSEVKNFIEENQMIDNVDLESSGDRFLSKSEERASFPLLQAIDYIGIGDEDSVPILLSLASLPFDSSMIEIKFQNYDSLDDQYEFDESFRFDRKTNVSEIKNYLLNNLWEFKDIQNFELFYQNCILLDQMKIEEILQKFDIKKTSFLIKFKINF